MAPSVVSSPGSQASQFPNIRFLTRLFLEHVSVAEQTFGS